MAAHPTSTLPNSINAAFWNARGLLSGRDELGEFVNRYELDVILVNETQLRNTHRDQKIPGYILLRRDRPYGPGGGVAIYPLCCSRNKQPPPGGHRYSNTERNGSLRLFFCYNRPSSTLIEGELNELLSQNAPTIAAGNFNAKHPNWHSSRTNASGRVLVNYAFENDVIIVSPDEPTRYEWAFFPNTWTSSSRKMSLTKFE
jgi:hypothetical protein